MMNGSDDITASTSKGNYNPQTWNGAQNGFVQSATVNGPSGFTGGGFPQPSLPQPPPLYNQPQWRPPGPQVPLMPPQMQPPQQRYPMSDRSQLQSPISSVNGSSPSQPPPMGSSTFGANRASSPATYPSASTFSSFNQTATNRYAPPAVMTGVRQPPPPMGQPNSFPPPPNALGFSNQMAQAGPRLPPPPQMNQAGMMPPQPPMNQNSLANDFNRLGIQQQQQQSQMAESNRVINLLQHRNLWSIEEIAEASSDASWESAEGNEINICPGIFRSTLKSIPQTSDLLKKSRLPLGLILHPFKDMKSLSVLQTQPIVRCRACRAYINPFAQIMGSRRWRCNLCFRENELPDDFSYDPRSKSYGDPHRRPEMKETTVEYVATSEYMLRPPQDPYYIFLLDVTASAIDTGYLDIFCEMLIKYLDRLPGDKKTQIAFIAYDSVIRFYQFSIEFTRPRELVVTDLDDVFLPAYTGFLANLSVHRQTIIEFLKNLPSTFSSPVDNKSALGAALTAAYELLSPYGGRITVMQTVLPNIGPGSLESREDPNIRASKDVQNIKPATDYYKTLALNCSGKQVAVDLFLLSGQYADLSTLAEMSKFNGGCVYHFPGLHVARNSLEVYRFEHEFARYLTRKIGFEGVLRLRCSKGLTLHTFHGNAFVRSTDLLALANINPDCSFGIQLQYEDAIETSAVCFQAALLYTNSKEQRRIRVHTISIPVTNNLVEVHQNADSAAIVCMLAKMAVDRCVTGTMSDAREALVNAAVDALGSFGSTLALNQRLAAVPATKGLAMLPMFLLGLLKHPAFNYGTSIKLDSRVFAMCQFKTAPVDVCMLEIYPAMYALHTSDNQRLHLTYEKVDRHGCYLLDTGRNLYIYVGQAVSDEFCRNVFGVDNFAQIDDEVMELPDVDSPQSVAVRNFITGLRSERSAAAPLQLIKDGTPAKGLFSGRLVEDKTESTFGYVEFLQYIQREISPKR